MIRDYAKVSHDDFRHGHHLSIWGIFDNLLPGNIKENGAPADIFSQLLRAGGLGCPARNGEYPGLLHGRFVCEAEKVDCVFVEYFFQHITGNAGHLQDFQFPVPGIWNIWEI